MSTALDPDPVQMFVVVATIRDDTNFADFAALRADEQKQLALLQSDGRIRCPPRRPHPADRIS